MATAFIIFLALAILHLIYESIIAPSLRLKLSFDLFKLRDDARSLIIKNEKQLDGHHFEYLQDSINILLKSLHNFDIILLALAMIEINKNTALKERIDKRIKTFDDCKLPEAMEIRKKTFDVADKALLINNGGWFVYLIPIVLAIVFYKTVTVYVKEIYSLSESDFNKVSPEKAFC